MATSNAPVYSKVKASATGSVGGVALAAVVIWSLAAAGVDTAGFPEWALAVILSPVGAFWAGWATEEKAGDKTYDSPATYDGEDTPPL